MSAPFNRRPSRYRQPMPTNRLRLTKGTGKFCPRMPAAAQAPWPRVNARREEGSHVE